MAIPKNVQDMLDNEGNILEDLVEENDLDEDTEENSENLEEDSENQEESDTTNESSEDTEEESEGQGEDESEDKEEDLELTPKKPKQSQEDDPSEITRKILEKLDSISSTDKSKDKTSEKPAPTNESDNDRRVRELEERLAAYENRNDSLNRENFISDVREKVKNVFPKHSLEEISNSQQFDEYLNNTVFGVSKRTLLKRAMDERDREATFEIFRDFKNSRSPKKDTTKASLDELAVPEKSGTKSAPKRRAKFDFKQSEFEEKLGKFQRGKMIKKDFDEFATKFNKALNEGRVDMDN